MSRNTLYLVTAVLAVVVIAFGAYYFYEQSQTPSLQIKVGTQSLTIK